ncbi:MAG: hypothetical protein OHK0022_19180 [Roseiflexaceae bacterium]
MRLLIMTCSARKRNDEELLPAHERYDGPLWQVLRAYRREQPLLAVDLEVYVLSAEFGLISDDHPVPLYDQAMTQARAEALRPQAMERLSRLLSKPPDAVCFALSQRYLSALDGWRDLISAGTSATVTDGPLGTKLGQLRAWLEGRTWVATPEAAMRLTARAEPRGSATVRGRQITMTRAQVLEHARRALADDGTGSTSYRDWYVLIDGQPVAPKWLVSVLTGLPTTAFNAPDARRALLLLGFDVERVQREEL